MENTVTKIVDTSLPFAGESLKSKALRPSRPLIVFALVQLGLALLLSSMSLLSWPGVHPDEAFYADLAQNWIETGNRWTTIDVGPFAGGRGQGTTQLGALPARIAVQLGGVNLLSLRRISLLAGMAVLVAVVWLGVQLWNWRVGLLTAMLLALSSHFVAGSHLARPEIWLALAVLLAFNASVRGWQRRQPLWDLAAAVLAGGALLIHQNGAVFALALAATYPARYGRRTWRHPNALAFFAAALAGAAFYLYANPWLLQAVRSGTGLLGGSHAIPLLAESPRLWLGRELTRYLELLTGPGAFWNGIFLLALRPALARRHAADRLVLVWIGGAALGYMLLVNKVYTLYLLPLLAVGVVLSGRLLLDLLENSNRSVRQSTTFACFLLLLPLLHYSFTAAGAQAVPFAHLRPVVPCQRILAPNEYWFAFQDCDFVSIDVINHYHFQQGLALDEIMANIGPDYLFVDASVRSKLAPDFGEAGSLYGYYPIPQDGFRDFLNQRATLLHLEGSLAVYSVRWEDKP